MVCDGNGHTGVWLFANLMELESCARRNAAFLVSCGVDPEAAETDLVGKSGYVECALNDRGYLEAERWLPQDDRSPPGPPERNPSEAKQQPWQTLSDPALPF